MRNIEEAEDTGELKAIRDVQTHGCHVLTVFDPDEQLPPFAYSVGIPSTCGAPELIVIGLKPDLAHSVINNYHRRIRAGERFAPGQRASDFLGGFDVEFRVMHPSHYEEYLGWAIWWHKGRDFDALQLVFPTTSGVWPWEAGASDWFKEQQPLLDAPLGPLSNSSGH